MSYEEGLRVGGFMSSLGNTFAGITKDNKQTAMKEEDVARGKRVKDLAMKIYENQETPDKPKHEIPDDIPLNERFDATVSAANLTSDKLRTNFDYEKQKAIQRSNKRFDFKGNLEKAEMALNQGDLNVAATFIAKGSVNAPTGWEAEFVQESPETGPSFLRSTNKLTGEKKDIPVTKESLGELVAQGQQWKGREDYDKADKLKDTDRRALNNELFRKRDILVDPNDPRKEMGVRYEAIDPVTNERRWIYQDANLKEVPPEALKGTVPESSLKREAELTTAKYHTEKANILGGSLGTPELDKAFPTQGGSTMAPLIGGGYGQVDPSMAPKQKPHMMGTVTDDKGNVQAIAQEDPYSTKVSKVETGIKTAPKDQKVRMIDPDTGEQVMISKDEEAGMRQTLKMAQELLKTTKDEKGNLLLLMDPDQMTPKDGEAYVDKLDRLIDDPKASEGVRHAAQTAKFHYQAFGVMPLDRKGAIGGKEKASTSDGKKASWKQYAPLN